MNKPDKCPISSLQLKHLGLLKYFMLLLTNKWFKCSQSQWSPAERCQVNQQHNRLVKSQNIYGKYSHLVFAVDWCIWQNCYLDVINGCWWTWTVISDTKACKPEEHRVGSEVGHSRAVRLGWYITVAATKGVGLRALDRTLNQGNWGTSV